MDKLVDIFIKQKMFQDKVGSDVHSISFIKDMTLAAIDELLEALREVSWKPWSKKKFFHSTEFKEELVDVLHFFVNLCLAADMSADELYKRYLQKNKINHKRQDEGY